MIADKLYGSMNKVLSNIYPLSLQQWLVGWTINEQQSIKSYGHILMWHFRQFAIIKIEQKDLSRWDAYVKNNPNLKGMRTYKSAYRLHVGPAFGRMEPKDILPLDIKRVSNRLLKTRSPQTVQHVLELLRRIINFGVNSKLCKGIDFKISMPRVDNIKTEDLTDSQLKRLLDTIDADPHPQAGTIMKMALFSAMRKSELLRLKWKHINFDKKFVLIVDPKGGKDQTIPLNDATAQLLTEYRIINPSNSNYVFPGRNGGQRTTIAIQVRRIRDKAGLPKDFRPLHGLRHVYASMLASSGKLIIP